MATAALELCDVEHANPQVQRCGWVRIFCGACQSEWDIALPEGERVQRTCMRCGSRAAVVARASGGTTRQLPWTSAPRQDQAVRYSEKQSERGKLGGRPRKESFGHPRASGLGTLDPALRYAVRGFS